MKILLLNPHVDAEHQIVRALRNQGFALLLPGNAEEALKMLHLHGSSVDLAIVHRESQKEGLGGEQGLTFVHMVKSDPAQADLPMILTSQIWADHEFATHQQSSSGVNAYLRWPFDGRELLGVIEAMFEGTVIKSPEIPPAEKTSLHIPVPEKTMATKQMAPLPVPIEIPDSPSYGPVLEQASDVFTNPALTLGKPKEERSIFLEAPPVEDGAKVDIIPPLREESPIIELSAPVTSVGSSSETPSSFPSIESELLPISGGVPNAQVLRELEGTGPIFSLPSSPDIPGPPPPERKTTFIAPPAPSISPIDEISDPQVAAEMPYLFNKGNVSSSPGQGGQGNGPVILFSQPVGDSVVPGGAVNAPDSETLKKYLLLREQDVAALSTQLKTAQDQLKLQEEFLRQERARNAELAHTVKEHQTKIDQFEKEKQMAIETLENEAAELRFQLKAKTDKGRILETQVRDATDQIEKLKERVRTDIRKIRIREKELENRLEIMKKDSEALIGARENKIIELKRKLDLIEFNMDLLQDQYMREKETSAKLRERLSKAAQVVRVAGGLLDTPGGAKAAEADSSSETDDSAEKSSKRNAS